MLDNGTKKRIDSARDILVGKVPDPKSQVEQITIAMIYKFMDDMDNQTEELGGKATFFAGEFKPYAWSRLLDRRLSGHERLLLYAEGIEKMNMNENIPQLFRDIFKGAFLPYRAPETLNLFLKEINGFAYDHSERLGDAFEYLLSVLSSQGDAGQFRTPRHVIDFMVEIVDPAKEDTVLDPACGTAGFLISSYKHILRQNTKTKEGDLLTADDKGRLMTNFCGYDISPDMVRLSLVNMYLHSFANPSIYEYDTLTSEDRWGERYDVILANPPFMSPKGGIRPHSRFTIKAKRSEVLFVDYIAEHLNVHGRAGVIVPEGIIFQSQNAYKNLRKMLVEEAYLYAVISLPAGIFNPYAGVKTSILLMDKTLAKKTGEILFVKVSNDGFDLGAQRRPIDKNDLPKALKIVKAWKQAIGEGKGFELNEYDKAIAHTVSKEKIAESGDYNLSGDRYKEVVSYANVKWPMVELGEVSEVNAGSSAPQDDRYFEDGTIPFFRTSDVGLMHISNCLTLSKDKVNNIALTNLKLKVWPAKSILFPKSGASTFLNHRVMLGTAGCVSSHLAVIIAKKDKTIPEYLFYLLLSVDAKTLTEDQNYPSLKLSDIKNIRIPLPPLKIQEKIIAELDSYQKIIDGAKQVVENYKPAIKIDSDWPMVELGKVCEINPKKSELKGLDDDLNVSFIPMSDMNQGEANLNVKQTRRLRDVLTNYTYFKNFDVLLAKITPCFENGKSAIAKGLQNGVGFGSTEFIVIRPDQDRIMPEIIYHFVSESMFLNKGALNMTGSAGQQRPSLDFVKKYPIPLPSLETQQKIVAEIETERELVDANKKLIEIFEKKIKDKIGEVWGE